MWFAVELPQELMLIEGSSSSIAVSPRQGRGRAGQPGPAGLQAPGGPLGAPVAMPAPVLSAILAATPYRCRRKSGTTWSKPVAEGKGDGAHTTVTFAPTRASSCGSRRPTRLQTRRPGRSETCGSRSVRQPRLRNRRRPCVLRRIAVDESSAGFARRRPTKIWKRTCSVTGIRCCPLEPSHA